MDNTRDLGSCSGLSLGQCQSWNCILQNVVNTEENWGKGEWIYLFIFVVCLTTTYKIYNDLKNGNCEKENETKSCTVFSKGLLRHTGVLLSFLVV